MASSDPPPNPTDDAAPAAATPKVERALEKLSRERPETMVEMMAVMGSGMLSPLQNKMDAEHISKVLALTSEHDAREFQLAQTKEGNTASDRTSTRRYVFAAFVLVMILLAIILFLFKEHSEILLPLVTGITGLGAGILAGFGIGKSQGK